MQRLISQLRWGTNGANDGITTTYTLDAAGRQLVQTVSAGGLSLSSSNTYDTAGRLLASVDNAGLTTTYGYNADGRTTTNTLPGGATQITERYLDGQVKSVTGTGVVAQYYDYGINADGTTWSCQYTGPNGLNSPVWAKTVQDVFGRSKYAIRPAFGGGSVTNESVYDASGRLVSVLTSSAGLQSSATLYAYDETNGLRRVALDANSNGVIDLSGSDRVTDAVTRYAKYGSDWFQETLSIIYAQDNANATTTGLQRVRLTGLGGTSASYSGVLTVETVALDILGNASTNQIWVDRTNKTVMQVRYTPASTQDVVSVSINGRLTSATSASAVVQTYAYDSLGRQISQSQVSGGGTRAVASVAHYNTLGQVDYTEDAAGHRSTYTYDGATGRRVSVTDPLTNAVYTVYDLLGRVTNTWGATYPVKYAFDEYGRMAAMTTYRQENGAGDTTTWLYDAASGLLTNKCYANNQGPSYSYDALGRLTQRAWARGLTTSYGYDSLGQMTNVVYSDSTPAVGFTLNRLGQQVTVTDGTGNRTFTYNDALQLAAETNVLGAISRQYDSPGRSSGFNLGTNYAVTYGYDAQGKYSSLTSDLGSQTSALFYSYLPDSDLLAGWSNGTIRVMRNFEDHRNLLTAVTNLAGGVLVSAFNYVNDAVGRRTQRIDAGSAVATNSFAYNPRSELTNAIMNANAFTWDLDSIGNRVSDTVNSLTHSYTANALNQYTQITNGGLRTLAYDLDGNLTNDSQFAYTWDGENRMVGATDGNTVESCAYDYMSRRNRKVVGSTTNNFLYDGWHLISETQVSGLTSQVCSYVWCLDLSGSLQGGGGIGGLLSVTRSTSSGMATYYPCYDANGNITDYVDTNGTVVAHREYDAYGNTLVATGAMVNDFHFWFSTKYLDQETGLYYYGYRYYSPELGRWISRDPIKERGGNNLYEFVNNNPIIHIDLHGDESWRMECRQITAEVLLGVMSVNCVGQSACRRRTSKSCCYIDRVHFEARLIGGGLGFNLPLWTTVSGESWQPTEYIVPDGSTGNAFGGRAIAAAIISANALVGGVTGALSLEVGDASTYAEWQISHTPNLQLGYNFIEGYIGYSFIIDASFARCSCSPLIAHLPAPFRDMPMSL